MVKTHVDIVGDFDRKGWKELRELAAKHNFVIMEDRCVCVVYRCSDNSIWYRLKVVSV